MNSRLPNQPRPLVIGGPRSVKPFCSRGRLTKTTLPDGSEITYGNYNWLAPGQIQSPGASKTLTYDALLRPAQIEIRNQATQLLASRSYQYDAAGNISQIDSEAGTTSYSYDRLNRLTQAKPDDNLKAQGLPWEQYSYDKVGNRTSSLHHGSGSWLYNADNQLTKYPRPSSIQETGSPFLPTQVSYTAHGHTARESNTSWERTLSYNAAERLIQYQSTVQGQTKPSLQASYRYDPFGRRIAKSVRENNQTRTTYYINGEQALMAEANEQGQLTTLYGFNPTMQDAQLGGLWSTDPVWLAQTKSSGGLDFHYLSTDHLGTPMMAVDQQGNPSWRGHAEAFGKVLKETGPLQLNLRFPGQYHDRETGLHQNWFRDYNPNTGRYLQSDPIGFEGGLNFYTYADGNPLLYYDSYGLWSMTFGLFAGRGADITFGKNPNGSGFMSLRFGYGIGGGFTYSPLGKNVGYEDCQGASWGLGLGFYGRGAGNVGPLGWNFGANIGRTFRSPGNKLYKGPIGDVVMKNTWGINASVSLGAQITLSGGGLAKGACTCDGY